jgi:hypothetical protein
VGYSPVAPRAQQVEKWARWPVLPKKTTAPRERVNPENSAEASRVKRWSVKRYKFSGGVIRFGGSVVLPFYPLAEQNYAVYS